MLYYTFWVLQWLGCSIKNHSVDYLVVCNICRLQVNMRLCYYCSVISHNYQGRQNWMQHNITEVLAPLVSKLILASWKLKSAACCTLHSSPCSIPLIKDTCQHGFFNYCFALLQNCDELNIEELKTSMALMVYQKLVLMNFR